MSHKLFQSRKTLAVLAFMFVASFSTMANVIKFAAINLDALFIPAIIAAGFAMKAFTVAVLANPFGLILAGVTTAAMAIYVFRNTYIDLKEEFLDI